MVFLREVDLCTVAGVVFLREVGVRKVSRRYVGRNLLDLKYSEIATLDIPMREDTAAAPNTPFPINSIAVTISLFSLANCSARRCLSVWGGELESVANFCQSIGDSVSSLSDSLLRGGAVPFGAVPPWTAPLGAAPPWTAPFGAVPPWTAPPWAESTRPIGVVVHDDSQSSPGHFM